MVNIATGVWAQADEQPDKVAVRSALGALTYAELRDRGARVCARVRAAGIGPGARVVLLAPTVLEFPVLYYGLHAAGVTVITMNTVSTESEISYVLTDSGASLVVALAQVAASARAAAERSHVPVWVVPDGARFTDEPDLSIHEHDADDTAVILYTSGTTGRPKGAELTTGNLQTAATMLLDQIDFTSDSRMATALPLFHVYGQAVVLNPALISGASISLVTPFDPVVMLETIGRDEATHVSGVPTMWNTMLGAVRAGAPAEFGHLRFANSGGAALPGEILQELKDRLGCDLLEGYGLTEATGLVTTHTMNTRLKAGTVGPPAPETVVEIRDADGTVLEVGAVGEIFAKGPTIMKGYWNRPEETAATLADGWLRTGDLGHLDADGHLTIVGRSKDLIIRGGYNVYPREVEEVLYGHPDIVDVAVLGVPDDRLGEEVAAAVVLRTGATTTGEEIRDWAREQLSGYKVPRLFQFLPDLPKGSTGKILKRALDLDEFRSPPTR